jgi:hypothetical protein
MYATGLTLFYYDQRVRKEGFDIEWMMEAAGMNLPAPVAETPPASVPLETDAKAPAPPAPADIESPTGPLQPPEDEPAAGTDTPQPPPESPSE